MLDLERLTHAEVDALAFSVHAVMERPEYFLVDVPQETREALLLLMLQLEREAETRPLPPTNVALAMPS